MTQIPQQPEFQKNLNNPEQYKYAFYNPDYKLWVTFSKKELDHTLDVTEAAEYILGLKNNPTQVNEVLVSNDQSAFGAMAVGFVRNAEFADYVLLGFDNLNDKITTGQLFKHNGTLAKLDDIKPCLESFAGQAKKEHIKNKVNRYPN
jgi:hypothetical protein